MTHKMNAISLFSSSGIGDLGLRANGIETIIACELIKERMALFKNNYPNAKCFCGNIWEKQSDIINYYNTNYDYPPFIMLVTPPCQGMSANGMGKLLSDYRKGLRSKFDERNRLIIPAVRIIKELRPEWIILENVHNMENTYIYDEDEQLVNIIDFIRRELGNEYVGTPQTIDCADYGVPEHRVRLITVLSRTEKGRYHFNKYNTFLPPETHSKHGTNSKQQWVSLRDAIGNLPALRAEKGLNADNANPLHKVPLLDNKKLWWLDNTPEGNTAFNNQCVNPSCRNNNVAIHGATRDSNGINKVNQHTPLYCDICGSLLPRPYVEDKSTGEKRLMKGYTSAYKRMCWDEPASTITQNFQYACSDNKVHPSQTRVLSLWEGLVIHTIADYTYSFLIKNKLVNDGLIRDTIGESVPPKIIDLIVKNILAICNNQ